MTAGDCRATPEPPAVERNGGACLCRGQHCPRHRSWHSGALAEIERLRELAETADTLRELDSLLSMQIESGNALSLDGQRELREMIATAIGGQSEDRAVAEQLARALEATNLVNPPAALAEYRLAYPREEAEQ